MFLGLVGVPTVPIGYPAYGALKAAAPALGAALAGAELAALGAIAAQGALVVGAGLGGYLIGDAIRKQLDAAAPPLPATTFQTGGVAGERVRLFFTLSDGVNPNINSSIDVDAPFAAVLQTFNADGTITFYALNPATGVRTNFAQAGTLAGADPQVTVTNAVKVAGGAPTNLRRVPTPRLPSKTEPFKRPTTVPIPGITPDFPITPTVVPNPGNDPSEEGTETKPGIVVNIPEAGLQITFSPDGVTIGRLRSPETQPFEVPEVPKPPGGNKVASPPCPCPEPESDPELLCRVKTLQAEILDDGFNFTSRTTPIGQSGFFDEPGSVFERVEIDITEFPANVRIQPSTFPVPDVYYIGWFSWLADGDPGERIPLSFRGSGFTPPLGVTGFMYQLNKSSLGFATYVTKIKRPYIDRC